MSYTHFTLSERFCLQDFLNQGKSFREIAKLMSRSPSSISREVRRNFSKQKKHYNAHRATVLYIIRRRKCVRKAIIQKDSRLYNMINECLLKYWSPEITAHYCRKHGQPISCSTIYKAVRAGVFAGISAKTHFRRRGKRRYVYRMRSKSATIKPERTIHERPLSANNRSRFGHLEGDTVCGAKNKSCIVTLVDRKSKILTAAISFDHTKAAVRKATARAVQLLEYPLPIRTITLDNGSEFADFKGIEQDLNTTIYFADPHAPWQRGLNENTNDMLRFFFPKGTDFSLITEERLQEVVHIINSRPRKCLGYLSPLEFLTKKCCT